MPACPKSMSLPEPPIRVSLPSPPKRLADGSAPLASSREIMSLPACPKTWMSDVLATVGAPPATEMAPPLTRMLPATSRLTTIVLDWASPKTVRTCAPGENVAETAGRIRSPSCSRVGKTRPRSGCLRPDRETGGRDFCFSIRLNQDCAMKNLQEVKRGTTAPPADLDHPAGDGRGAHRGRPLRKEKRPCWASADKTRGNGRRPLRGKPPCRKGPRTG